MEVEEKISLCPVWWQRRREVGKAFSNMRRIFYVDVAMCGGESLPEDFDLEEFCEVLQGKVMADVEIVPVTEATAGRSNRDTSLVSDAVFFEALGEYCHR